MRQTWLHPANSAVVSVKTNGLAFSGPCGVSPYSTTCTFTCITIYNHWISSLSVTNAQNIIIVIPKSRNEIAHIFHLLIFKDSDKS